MNIEKKQLDNLSLILAIISIVQWGFTYINYNLTLIASVGIIVLATIVILKSRTLQVNTVGAKLLLVAMVIQFIYGIINLAINNSALADSGTTYTWLIVLFTIISTIIHVLQIFGTAFCFKNSGKLNNEVSLPNEQIQNNLIFILNLVLGVVAIFYVVTNFLTGITTIHFTFEIATIVLSLIVLGYSLDNKVERLAPILILTSILLIDLLIPLIGNVSLFFIAISVNSENIGTATTIMILVKAAISIISIIGIFLCFKNAYIHQKNHVS